jgi:hypothetical protein
LKGQGLRRKKTTIKGLAKSSLKKGSGVESVFAETKEAVDALTRLPEGVK